MQTLVGTLDYMAPEIISSMFADDEEDNGDGLQYTVAVDIWSLVCVLFRLHTQRSPFASVGTLGAYRRSKKSFLQMLFLNRGSVKMVSLFSWK